MAEFDYQRALEMAFRPLNTLGSGKIAIEEARLRRAQQLQDEANRQQFITRIRDEDRQSQMVDRMEQRAFQTGQSQDYQRFALDQQRLGQEFNRELAGVRRTEMVLDQQYAEQQKEFARLRSLQEATGAGGDYREWGQADIEKAYGKGTDTLKALIRKQDVALREAMGELKIDPNVIEQLARDAFLADPQNGLNEAQIRAVRNSSKSTAEAIASIKDEDARTLASGNYAKLLKDARETAVAGSQASASVKARDATNRYNSLNQEIAKLQQVLPAAVTAKAFLDDDLPPPPPQTPPPGADLDPDNLIPFRPVGSQGSAATPPPSVGAPAVATGGPNFFTPFADVGGQIGRGIKSFAGFTGGTSQPPPPLADYSFLGANAPPSQLSGPVGPVPVNGRAASVYDIQPLQQQIQPIPDTGAVGYPPGQAGLVEPEQFRVANTEAQIQAVLGTTNPDTQQRAFKMYAQDRGLSEEQAREEVGQLLAAAVTDPDGPEYQTIRSYLEKASNGLGRGVTRYNTIQPMSPQMESPVPAIMPYR